MIAYIKNYSMLVIKKKLIFLYMLNVLDIMFTLVLLKTGIFMEVNILMVDTVNNPIQVFLMKAVLPALLLFFIYIRMQKATEKQLKQSNVIINIATCIYIIVNMLHILWVSLIPFFISLI